MSVTPESPTRAPVRPRILAPGASHPNLLEDEIEQRLRDRRGFELLLTGPCGRGKTRALQHLAARFGGETRLRLVDDDPRSISSRPSSRLPCSTTPT